MHRFEVPSPRMHRLQVHRPCWVRRACRCQLRHRLKVHRPFRVRRACRCPRRLKVHRPLRVRRACKCLQMHRLQVHRPYRVRRACRCPHMHGLKVHRPLQVAAKAQLKVHRPFRVRRARRCPHMYRLKVHRPFRVRRAYRCQQGTGSRCTGQSGSGVLADARTLNQGAHAPPGQACPQAPANVAVATGPQVLVAAHATVGLFVRRPRFSRCRRSSVPIAAQTVVGLVPGVRCRRFSSGQASE